MKLLVGYTADERGAEAIELASALVAGTKDAFVQIAIVLPAAAPFTAVYPGGDHGYETILSAQVDRWAAEALALVPEGIGASVAARSVSSIAEGLIELGEEFQAHGIVLGGRKRHLGGFFMPGAIANALLHSSPLPVFMTSPASLDNLREAGGRITRLTAFVGDRPGAREIISLAARLANARDVKLRVANFVAHADVSDGPAGIDDHVRGIREYLDELVKELGIEAIIEVIASGSIDTAINELSWQPGDLALLGSARLAAHRRLFIGPKAHRILGHLNVPMGVVPHLPSTR